MSAIKCFLINRTVMNAISREDFPGIVSFVNATGSSRLLWDRLNKVHSEYYDNCSMLNYKLPCRLRI